MPQSYPESTIQPLRQRYVTNKSHNMKVFIQTVILAVITLYTMACNKNKDRTNETFSAALAGTTWADRSSANPQTRYVILRFKDIKNVEWITKNSAASPETISFYTYKLINNQLTIQDDPLTWSAEINGTQFNLRPDIGNNFFTFIRE